jgi:hypothetical protein
MSIAVEAYTVGGIVTGALLTELRLKDVLEEGLVLPIGGGIPPDDLMAVVDVDPLVPVHASWHRIRLEVGPYAIEGDFSTLPGFDPGRALTRPSGTFVNLRDAVVQLRDRPDAGSNAHPHLLVNRYAVESVDADIMLGFFFPGAVMSGLPEAPPAPNLGG